MELECALLECATVQRGGGVAKRRPSVRSISHNLLHLVLLYYIEPIRSVAVHLLSARE